MSRSHRLKTWDYAAPGYYFLTVCTRDRDCILSQINSVPTVGAPIGRPLLSCAGEIVQQCLLAMEKRYSAVEIDEFVIMPNHIHLILKICGDEEGRPMGAPTVSTLMNQWKGAASKQAGGPLWQRGFYDHILRDEAEYLLVKDYIQTNPLRWQLDRFYTAP